MAGAPEGRWYSARSMGSPLRLTIGGVSSGDQGPGAMPVVIADAAWAAVVAEFAASDAAMSRFSASSELTSLNRSAGSGAAVAVGRRLELALVAADRARRLTGGRFDPRVLVALEAIGEAGAEIGAARTKEAGGTGRDAPVLSRHGRGSISIEHPVDLGGIGKGLALRWAARAVERAGCRDFLLDAGGDLVLRGAAPGGGPWQVGIEDPAGGGAPLAVIVPRNGAVVTSSLRNRSWSHDGRAVHHLIDPATGDPAETGLYAVTAMASDPAWAEVWAKSLFVAGREVIADLARARGLAAWWVTVAGTLEMTPAARALTCWVGGEAG